VTTTAVQQITVPALATVPGVDLCAAGQWDLSSGLATFTAEELAQAVDAAACPAIGPPVIKLGHLDDRFINPGHDGTPALGRVANMVLAAEGMKLQGDLEGLPGWLAAVLPSAYPQRSIEANGPVTCQIGHVHPFVISALALLGITKPGVGVLSSLDDVAALYDVQAASPATPAAGWRLTLPPEASMPPQIVAAGVTTEDVRRSYYDTPGVPYSYWITEIQLSPPQLIVCDESSNTVYRVPVKISGSTCTFGDAVEVQIEYVDVAASARLRRALGSSLVWASAAESRAGFVVRATWDAGTQLKNMGDDPSAAAIKKMFAIPADTKSASKLPHHDCSADGKVGAANPAGCSAGIGAINGAHGGIKGVAAAAAKAAYNHMASHLRKAGQEPPDYSGPAASASERYQFAAAYRLAAQRAVAAQAADADESVAEMVAALDAILDQASMLAEAGPDNDQALPPEVAQALNLLVGAEAIVDQLMDMLGIYDPDDEVPDAEAVTAAALAAGKHAAYSGSHSHPHAAYGGQGGDMTHEHAHTHSGDAVHNHAHAGAGHNEREGGTPVDFKLTDEQTAQLRRDLGLGEGAELSVDDLLAAAKAQADKGVAASSALPGNLPDSVVVIDRDAWSEQGKRIAAMEAAEGRRRADERDTVISAAISAGKFGPAKRDDWAKIWDKDPDGTRRVIAGLTPNVVPVSDVGAGGTDPDEEFEREYKHLFGPQAQPGR